jgi:hypothetical protein
VLVERKRGRSGVAAVPAMDDSTTAAYMHRAVVFSTRRNGVMGDAIVATSWLGEAPTNMGIGISVWRILGAEPFVVEFPPTQGAHARGLSSRRCGWANANEADDDCLWEPRVLRPGRTV